MAELPSFEIALGPSSRDCAISLNGDDISAMVTGVEISHHFNSGSLPQVAVQFAAGAVKVNGAAEVFSLINSQAIAQAISQVDPQQLEVAALERAGYGENVTVATLKILEEQFSAES